MLQQVGLEPTWHVTDNLDLRDGIEWAVNDVTADFSVKLIDRPIYTEHE